MRLAVGFAWRSISLLFIITVLFLCTISPARAPKGGRYSLGGRTIASIQEEDFDKKLLNYQVCYGVSFDAGAATQERRRACKAMLVHKLEANFSRSGAFLTTPIQFRCENTNIGPTEWLDWEGHPIVALHPNHEFAAMDAILAKAMDKIQADPERELAARELCHYLADCKDALRFDHFSFRRIAGCVFTKNAERRNAMLNTFGNMVFHSRHSSEKLLFAEMLRGEQP